MFHAIYHLDPNAHITGAEKSSGNSPCPYIKSPSTKTTWNAKCNKKKPITSQTPLSGGGEKCQEIGRTIVARPHVGLVDIGCACLPIHRIIITNSGSATWVGGLTNERSILFVLLNWKEEEQKRWHIQTIA